MTVRVTLGRVPDPRTQNAGPWCLFGVYYWTAPGRLRRPHYHGSDRVHCSSDQLRQKEFVRRFWHAGWQLRDQLDKLWCGCGGGSRGGVWKSDPLGLLLLWLQLEPGVKDIFPPGVNKVLEIASITLYRDIYNIGSNIFWWTREFDASPVQPHPGLQPNSESGGLHSPSPEEGTQCCASLEPLYYLPNEFHDFWRDQLDRGDHKQDQSR